MNFWKTLLVSAAFWAAMNPCLSEDREDFGDAESSETIQPPVPTYKVSPKHPPSLYLQAIEGSAVVIATVDMFGNLVDPEVESATHDEFGLAAMMAASEWKFQPATKNSIPIDIGVKIPFEFEIAFEHKMNIEVGRELFTEIANPVIPSSDLDEAPLPSFIPSFSDYYPESLKGSGKSASASLEFVIAPSGEVLNPQILSISDTTFETAALLAVGNMKYNPVLLDGKAVYVSTIRPIQLSEF